MEECGWLAVNAESLERKTIQHVKAMKVKEIRYVLKGRPRLPPSGGGQAGAGRATSPN
jgi:hypothetical protein